MVTSGFVPVATSSRSSAWSNYLAYNARLLTPAGASAQKIIGTNMASKKLPAGMRVQYQLDDGIIREGTVAKTVTGLGFSVVCLDGMRRLIPSENVRAWPI